MAGRSRTLSSGGGYRGGLSWGDNDDDAGEYLWSFEFGHRDRDKDRQGSGIKFM